MQSTQVPSAIDIDSLSSDKAIPSKHESHVSDLLHCAKTAYRHKIGLQFLKAATISVLIVPGANAFTVMPSFGGGGSRSHVSKIDREKYHYKHRGDHRADQQ
ncbi:MAG TPA: hypothetical protein VMS18_00815 [Candidatus Binatia bacterium]|nr:hypothetical protein [Candidatus Binatia bacterium]